MRRRWQKGYVQRISLILTGEFMSGVLKWGTRVAAVISSSSLIAIPFGHYSPGYMTLTDCIMLLIWVHMEWEIRQDQKTGPQNED